MIDVVSVIIVLFSVWEIKRTRRILSIERVNRAHCCGANVLLLRANFGVVPALARLSASEIPIVWVSAF